jgi:hypothetical protein
MISFFHVLTQFLGGVSDMVQLQATAHVTDSQNTIRGIPEEMPEPGTTVIDEQSI